MIKHIVMWTLKDEAEGAGKAANASVSAAPSTKASSAGSSPAKRR